MIWVVVKSLRASKMALKSDGNVYLPTLYLASKQSFIIFVMLPDSVEAASMYTARITVANDRRKRIEEIPVLSIEDLPEIENDEAKFKYLFVSHESMEPFFSDVTDFQVEVLKMEKSKWRKLM